MYLNLGSRSIETQVELGGEEMTTRALDLSLQGTAESYVTIIASPSCAGTCEPMSMPSLLLYNDDLPSALAGADAALDDF